METAFAQTQVKVGTNINAWDAILHASPVVQLTLLILIVLSVLCWAVIFQKRKEFNVLKEANDEFLNVFWKASSLEEVQNRISEFNKSNVANLFESIYNELHRLADSNLSQSLSAQKGSVSGVSGPKLGGLENLNRTFRKSMDTEIAKLESRLTLLATTGSTGPFIGLFGTVWGIMGSFQNIGATGAASLAVVAPGISEALIATAIGLAAAIPAVVAYNHFISQVKKQELELSNFGSDFLNIIKRNFSKE